MTIIETTDYETIARLNESIQTAHSILYPEYFKEYNYEDIKNFFKNVATKPETIFLLLKENEQFLGYGWLEITNYPENAFKKAHQSLCIHHICLLEAERKKGYGLKLLERVYEIAGAKQIKRVILDYWYENTLAKDFFYKNGFVRYRDFLYKDL